jgi:hypothetical protein
VVSTVANPASFTVPLTTENPDFGLTVALEDNSTLPIVNGLETLLVSRSVDLKFVVNVSKTAPNSAIYCGLYEADSNGLLSGVVGLVNNLISGTATIEFAPQTPSAATQIMTIPTTCTYSPGLLGVAAKIDCIGATLNVSTDLLSLLDNKQFIMLCAEKGTSGTFVATGQSSPMRLATGVLGTIGL